MSTEPIHEGDCVRISDGRPGRVRQELDGRYRVRVRRQTSKRHQFLVFAARELTRIDCPQGWMSPEGYNRYLRETLAKMRERKEASAYGRATSEPGP